MIPCGNPKAQYLAHKDEIDAAVLRALASGAYINGPECEAFEAEFARWAECAHAVGVANGTDALRVALAALGIGPGDEVITVSHTAVATVAAIELTGASPVLVDTGRDSYTIDVGQVEKAIGPKTRAVIAVHLFGNPCDLEALTSLCRARDVRLIEDCAQAHGARFAGKRVGTFGDLACYSFYPTKNLGAIGDGGMVVTSRPELAKRCRAIREYGWEERFISKITGMNSRLDELQAALLRVKLKYLDADNAARGAIAARYGELLAGLPIQLPKVRAGDTHAYHLYVIRTARRDELKEHLRASGVGTGIHYPMPVHQQPAYVGRVKTSGNLTQTEAAAFEILSLPMFPELSAREVEQTAAAVRAWCSR